MPQKPDHLYIGNTRYEPVDPVPGPGQLFLGAIIGLYVVLAAIVGFIIWLLTTYYSFFLACAFGAISIIVIYSVVRLIIGEHFEQPPLLSKLLSLFSSFLVALAGAAAIAFTYLLAYLIFSGGNLKDLSGFPALLCILMILALHAIGGRYVTKITGKSFLLGGISSLCASVVINLVFVYIAHLGSLTTFFSLAELIFFIICWAASIGGGTVGMTLQQKR